MSTHMSARRSSLKTRLSLSTFGQLHHRTASLKSQGIPLLPLEGSYPSDLDLFSVSENENEPELDDDPGGTFDDPNTFQVIDMNAQDQASTTLPPPALQRRFSQSSTRKDGEDDSTTIARLKKHLFAEVDGEQSTAPLSAYCFMTGFMCVYHTFYSLRVLISSLFLQRFCYIFCYICLVCIPNGKQCTSMSTSTVADDLPN